MTASPAMFDAGLTAAVKRIPGAGLEGYNQPEAAA